MRFQEGNTNGVGRPKGSKNKLNIDIKNAFDNVYDKMGGEETLLKWAQGHKKSFYEIWARMYPKKLQASIEHHPHEDFIKRCAEELAKNKLEAGQPFKMIETEAVEMGNEPQNKANCGEETPQKT